MRVRLIALALWLAAGAAQARPVVVLRSDLWCPYNCAPGTDRPGYAVEIAQAVFGAAGYDVDYQLLNWARSVEDARVGRADGVIGAFATDVPGFVVPHEPIGLSSAAFAVRRGVAFHYTGPHALDGRVLGVVATYEFAGALGAYVREVRADRTRVQYMAGDGALAKNLFKLLAGRLDVVLDDAYVLSTTIAELGLGDRVTFSREGEAMPVYIAFSPVNPDSPHLAAILSEGIARLRASGRLAAILARYGVRDWH